MPPTAPLSSPDQGKAHAKRASSKHKAGVKRPESHSGKYKPGSRKGKWEKVVAVAARAAHGCMKCQELEALATQAVRRAEAAERQAADLRQQLHDRIPVYPPRVPKSWQCH